MQTKHPDYVKKIHNYYYYYYLLKKKQKLCNDQKTMYITVGDGSKESAVRASYEVCLLITE